MRTKFFEQRNFAAFIRVSRKRSVRQQPMWPGGTRLKKREIGLIEGFLLCLCDSHTVRLQTSQWKRGLLVFSSGVCLELAALPLLAVLIGWEFPWFAWLLTAFFGPLGLLGLYASKFGDDRLVESLLVVPKLDLGL